MYDDIAILRSYGAPTFDTYGNEITAVEDRQIYVQPRTIYASEFYGAAQAGLKPSVTLYLTHRDDYHGEKVVIYHGREYRVIRADFKAQRDGLSLILEERVDANG